MVTRKQMLFGQEFFTFMRDILVMVVSASLSPAIQGRTSTQQSTFSPPSFSRRNKSADSGLGGCHSQSPASNFAVYVPFWRK